MVGGKTGRTRGCRSCLMTMAERDGRKVVVIVLRSTREAVVDDTRALLDLGFNRPLVEATPPPATPTPTPPPAPTATEAPPTVTPSPPAATPTFPPTTMSPTPTEAPAGSAGGGERPGAAGGAPNERDQIAAPTATAGAASGIALGAGVAERQDAAGPNAGGTATDWAPLAAGVLAVGGAGLVLWRRRASGR